MPDSTHVSSATQTLDGDLTISHAAHLQSVLLDWLAAGTSVVDLATVAECDASGIQLMCAALQTAKSNGQSLSLVNVAAPVTEALRTCGLSVELQPLPISH